MSARIPGRVVFGYALPAFALAAVGIPVYVYLPKFYSDVVGASVTTLGILLGSVRIIDAFTDPLIGILSDRTRTRHGRRRPFIGLGSIPLALALGLLFAPPTLGPSAAAWWFGIGIFILFLCWTLVAVPYEALGTELSDDYHERTRLLGTRDGFLIAGTLAAVIAPEVISRFVATPSSDASQRTTFLIMAVLYAPLLLGTCFVCTRLVREPRGIAALPTQRGPWNDMRTALGNRPFRILLVSYTLSAFGSNLPATLILYYVQYVLESDRAGLFLILYMGCGILFLPLWIRLALKFGKKPAWLAAMALNTGSFLFVFFLGPGAEGFYGALVILSGIGFGATLALPSAMQADVIDYHELLTGTRSEGCYVGLWSVAKKLAAALGIGVALFALGRAGYVPNQPQPARVRLVLRTLYALVPCACNLAGLLVALRYPISKAAHDRIREGIRNPEKKDFRL
jgi:GPH family glycoside/pentoside/hexuronide:cation symporter